MTRLTLSLLVCAALFGCKNKGETTTSSNESLSCAERATIAHNCVPNGRSISQLTAECEQAQNDPQKRELNRVTGACFTQHKADCPKLQDCILKGISQSHPEAD